jgi:Trk-type K+ transport system membrane component
VQYRVDQDASIKDRTFAHVKDEEFRFAIAIVVLATALICMIGKVGGVDVRYAAYMVISIMYTCGFANTMDYNNWTEAAKMILIVLMLIGGCLGSTAGGIKVDVVKTAVKAGADIIVVGRAITASKDIYHAAEEFLEELSREEIDQFRIITDF